MAGISSGFLLLALLRTIALPVKRIARLVQAQTAIIPAIGRAVWSWRMLTRAEIIAPVPMRQLPNKAAALPVCFENGASESAVALGPINP